MKYCVLIFKYKQQQQQQQQYCKQNKNKAVELPLWNDDKHNKSGPK